MRLVGCRLNLYVGLLKLVSRMGLLIGLLNLTYGMENMVTILRKGLWLNRTLCMLGGVSGGGCMNARVVFILGLLGLIVLGRRLCLVILLLWGMENCRC